jgi:hypothetical protein
LVSRFRRNIIARHELVHVRAEWVRSTRKRQRLVVSPKGVRQVGHYGMLVEQVLRIEFEGQAQRFVRLTHFESVNKTEVGLREPGHTGVGLDVANAEGTCRRILGELGPSAALSLYWLLPKSCSR